MLKKGLASGAAGFCVALVFAATAHAAQVEWDADGLYSVGGGGNTWNTTAPWWLSPSGYGVWNNAALDDALFQYTAGTVTAVQTLNVHNITFNVSGYILGGTSYGPLVLGGTSPTITVTDPTGVATTTTATISTPIWGSAGLIKAGPGILILSNASASIPNTYAGNTAVNAGTLRLTASNLIPDGVGKGNVSLASGTTLEFNLNAALSETINGLSGAGTVNNANTGTTTLTVGNNDASGTFSGVISNSSGTLNLVKIGSGTLTLTGANTYTGTTTLGGTGGTLLKGGTVELSGASGRLASGAAFTLGLGSALRLSNTSAANNADRIGTGAISMNGAVLVFINDGSDAAFSETVGALTLASGLSLVSAYQAGASGTSAITFGTGAGAGLTRNAGATVAFKGVGLGADNRNRVVFNTAPTLDDGILGGWATANGTDFAKYVTSGTISVAPLAPADYTTTGEGTWAANKNVLVSSGTTTLTADRQVNSLNLAQTAGTTVDITAGKTLRVETGGILVSGAFDSAISNGTLTAGTGANTAGELIITNFSGKPLTISSTIADNGTGKVSLTMGGTSTTILSGAQTYTGATVINGGTLQLTNPPAPGPTSPIAGSLYWLDATAAGTITKDANNRVSAWSDNGGGGLTFTQGTLGNQPIYGANALNGNAMVRFDGVDDRLTLSSATTPQTVFIIGRTISSAQYTGIWGSDSPQTDKGIRIENSTTWRNPGDGNDFSNGAGGAIYVNGVLTNSFGSSGTPHLLEAYHGTSLNAYSTTHLGWYFSGRALNGDIGEVLVYGTVLSATDRVANENYLLAKWLGIQPGVLPSMTAVTLNNGGTLDLNGINQTIGSLAGAAGSTVALGGGTLNVGLDGTSTTFAGSITGNGNLAKMGSGALILAGPSTFVGTTTVNGGVLSVRDAAAVSTGAVTVNAGGELAVSNVTFSNAITLNGGSTISANVANPTVGSAPYMSTVTSSVTVGGAFTVAVRDYAAAATGTVLNLSGSLTGSGNMTVNGPTGGSGTLILSGNNSATYSGNFTVNNLAVLELLGTQARGSGTVTLGSGGTVRTSVDPAQTPGTLGADGVTSWYYNFGSSPGTASNRFGSDLLVSPARVFSRTDPNINIPWNVGTNPYGVNPANGAFPFIPVPNFSGGGINCGGLSRGIFNVATAGAYTFYAGSDDPGALYIDGLLVASSNVNEVASSPLPLSAGWHSIVMRFTQGTGGGGMTAYYVGPDTSNSKILVGGIPGTLKTGSLTPFNLGALTVSGGTGTVDMAVDTTASSLTMASGTTLQTTSPGLYTLTVNGATTLGGNVNINPVTGAIIFNGAIGQTAASTVTFNGGFLAVLNAANTYSGTTTVSSGEIDLNNTSGSGNAIPGALTINAANNEGPVSNVRLLQSNQIADGATVTMTNGILDLGANNETIATLAGTPTNWWSTRVIGTGTLTATSVTLTQGEIAARLSTAGGINRNTATVGPLILSGDNTYTGQTLVGVVAGGTASLLNIRSNNALGATGAGNDTIVYSGAQLQVQGGITSPEVITLNGAGIQSPYYTAVSGSGALRNMGGSNTLAGSVTLGSATTIQSDTGNLTMGGLNAASNALTLQGSGDITFSAAPANLGAVTKNGPGAVIFSYDVGATIPAASWTWNAGVLGFSGTQTLGAVTIGTTAPVAATTWRFNSDPGAGTTVTVPAATTLVAGYAADQALLSRITGASAGTLALAVNSSSNLDFTALPNLSLGSGSLATYSGTLTPGASGYLLGGGGGAGGGRSELTVTSPLTGANALAVNGTVRLNAANSFTGAVSINQGGLLRVVNNNEMGNAANVVTLNGGTLQLVSVTGSAGGEYLQLGNPIQDGSGNPLAGQRGRQIVVGAGGGTIDVPALGSGNSGAAITGVNGLTGSGTLTKTGLGFLFVLEPQNFSGNLNIANNGNQFDIRSMGTMLNVAGVTIGQSAYLNVDNQNQLMTRQYPGGASNLAYSVIPNRFNDAATISLQGGRLMYVARNVGLGAGTSTETFGATTVDVGQSEIRSERAGGGGADMILSNLIHNYGGGTVRFTSGGTIGQTGDSGRILLTQLNGVAPTANQFIGGWGVVDRGNPNMDFAAYVIPGSIGATGGIGYYGAAGYPTCATLANAPTPGTGNFTTGTIGQATGDVTLGTAGSPANFVVGAIRFQGGATRQVLFANATDTLYVESGGVLSDGNNNARNFGVTGTRGRLTAGLTTATTPQELFIHNSQSTFTIWSQIIDNPNNAAATVRVVKDLDAQVNLENSTNSYTGGTLVLRGTLEARAAQTLGLGAVTVKNSRLNLNVAGTIGAAAAAGGFTAVDQAEIYLNNGGVAFTTAWDRFVINPGSTIIGPNARNANQGLNSLTRVSGTPASGGDIQLLPDAIIGHQSFSNDNINGIGVQTIKNLGTAADLYFGLTGDFNPGVYGSLTIGAGTPWKGISTDRAAHTWQQGTIYANGDFYLQGLTRQDGIVALNLGGGGNNNYAIVNNAGKAINAYVIGQVALNDDVPPSMPGDLTFVITPGAVFQPNFSNSLGNPAVYPGTGYANILVQGGGTIDPGYFVNPVGFGTNQPYNQQYPIPGPLNGGLVTVEAGGRLLINDASGIGSGQAGNITMKKDAILDLATVNAFFGSYDPGSGNTKLVAPGQFVYEPGAIIRLGIDNIYKISQFAAGEPNGEKLVYEVFNGNRTLTSQINPFIFPTVGTSLYAPESIRIANGGMIVNDSNDRTLNQGRGTLILGDGAVLAATTQTQFYIQENIRAEANATIQIGSANWNLGQPRLGVVRLGGTNSNTAGANVTFRVVDGAELWLEGSNVFPDNAAIDLPTAPTYLPPAGTVPPVPPVWYPGNGSVLMVNNAYEVVGPLTGNGAVIGNNQNLVAGWAASSDYTFNGAFRFHNNANIGLIKVGPAKMTLTGTSDTNGEFSVMQGELVFAGPIGKVVPTTAATYRINKSGTLTLDNSVVAVDNRLGGATLRSLSGQGGTINLIGNDATPVTEAILQLNNGGGGIAPAGGLSFLNVTPGAATTTFQATTIESYTGGGRQTTWVLRSPTLGNLPGTYDANNVYTNNPGNSTNGLIRATNPNLWGASGILAAGNAIAGAAGTPVVDTRPDLLGDTSPTGQGVGFVTQDVSNQATVGFRLLTAAEYAPSFRDNMSTNLNVKLTGSTTTSGDTRIQTLTMTPGSTLNITGTLPYNLTPSRLFLNSPGVLVQSGAGGPATINGSYLQSLGGASLYLHTYGDLNLNAVAFSDTGIVKTGSGTLTFGPGAASLFRGPVNSTQGGLTIDGGTVVLGANNRFFITRQQNYFAGQNLNMNGGTLDLGGNSQLVSNLNSNNILPYGAAAGGTITSASPATLAVQGTGTASIFSGSIAGAISLDKIGNTTLTLTGNSPYAGSTSVRQGTLILRDEARFPNTSQLDINYATLQIDNSYLANVNDRINPAAPVNLRGATFELRGAPGLVSQQNFATVNLVQGQNTFNNYAGGGGATETLIGDLTRTPGSAVVSFNQPYGFVGAAGNDTDAVRYFISKVNGSPLTLTNNLVGPWAVWNNDHFATYLPTTGISYLSNQNDGYAGYESGDLTQALPYQNVNDGGSRTLAVSRTINALRYVNDNITLTINAGVTLTIASGGLITNSNNPNLGNVANQGAITSGTSDLYLWINRGTTIMNAAVTGNINVIKPGGGTLEFRANNTYTGTTYVDAGTLTLNRTGANATTDVAIPGDLVIHNATVTESIANQIKNTANVTLYAGGTLNLINAASTETLASLTLINNGGGGGTNVPVVQRAGAQAGLLNLTAPTAITASTDNPYSTPTIHVNIGTVNFTGAVGQAVNVTGNTWSPLGLIINANIGTVPAGGLIKTGTGMLALGGTGATQFGNPGVPTDVLDIQQGIVRVDAANALGTLNAVTVVENGAVLLSRGNNVITGSVRLKQGSTLGTSEADATFGTATTTIASQSVLTVAGDATVNVADYFMQGTQGYTINLNSKLTGTGAINLVGPQITSSAGIFRLGNNITDDPAVGGITAGANDYSGTITLNKNTILLAQSTAAGVTTGNELGTATINLNGGELRLRDDNTVTYGNNVTLSAPSFINADRTSAGSSKTITLGTLTVAAGTQSLTTTFTTGDNINTVNNTYRLAFSQIDGAGTLVKVGHQIIEINGYAPTFSGNLAVAGPLGIAVQPSSGLNLNAATNNIANLTVNGIFSPVASKTLNVSGVLEVGDNAGQVINGTNGITSGSVTGAMSVPSTATVTAATLRNNGIIGVTGGATAITASQLQGSGVYEAYGLAITLAGPANTPVPLNDGPTASKFSVAGNNQVNLNPAGGGTISGGAEVQGGTLRVAPTAPATDPFGTGIIRVMGYAAPTVTAATSATLQFDGGANAIAHGGSIVNSGLVKVTSGSVTVAGTISGPGANAYVPGLLEGYGGTWNSATPQNTGNFGIKLEPRMGEMNVVTQDPLTGWASNATWVYSGQFYDADGSFSFLSNIDDNTAVLIDGVSRSQYGGNLVVSTATTVGQRDNGITANANPNGGTMSFGMGPNGDGWHNIEIRFNNGGGGAGTYNAFNNGIHNNFGFGLNTDGTRALDGALYTRPIDPGNASLFRTPVAAKGNVQVDAGTSLTAAGISNTTTLTMATTSSVTLTQPGYANNADALTITGSSGAATLTQANGASFTTGNVTIPSAVTLNANASSGTAGLTITGNLTGPGSTLNLGNVNLTFNSNSAQASYANIAGTGNVAKLGTGTLTVAGNGTYSGTTDILAGTMKLGFQPVPGAALWLDASDASTITKDGSNRVSQWNDKSGNVRNATQATTTLQPLSTPNALVNGLSILRIDGTDDLMNVDLSFLAASNYTILAVEGRSSNKANNYFLGTTPAANNQGLHFGYRTDTQFTLAQYGNDLNSAAIPGYSTQTFSLWTGEFDAAAGHYLYLNGALNSSNANLVGMSTATGGMVGRGATAGYFYQGDLAEVLIYSSALPAGDRAAVEGYLKAKWFGSGTPNFIPDNSPVTVAFSATLDLNNYSETIGSLAGAGNVLLGAATLTTGGNGSTTVFSGQISGSGGLIKNGAGAMTLTNTNPFTGMTIVNNGALIVNGSIGGPATVNGGLLGGDGTVNGDVDVQPLGIISAGGSLVSTGTLSITGGYIATGTLVADLAGLNQGAAVDGYDLIHVLGAATLGGFVDVNLLSGFFPPGFSYFDILIADLGITNLDLSGVSIDFTDASLPVSWAWRADIVSLGGTQEALRLTVLSPEPGSLLLLGGGLLALLRRRRKAR